MRVRFGKDSWAYLDVDTPITIGGKAVRPGHYCLVLDCDKDGSWSLVLLDAQLMRRRGLPGFATMRVVGIGSLHGLKMSKAKKPAAEFTVEFERGKDPARTALRIAFGPHVLVAPVQFDVSKMVKIDLPAA
jgi:hypothetical protein